MSLPGAGSTGSVAGIGGLIKDGKLGTGALQQGALGGLGQLARHRAERSGSAGQCPPKPASNGSPAETKKGKKRQADASAAPSAAPPAAKQLLQNFLGN